MTEDKIKPMQYFYPQTPWAKWIAKAPLMLWRLGLGPLSGKVMMVITVTGRKSGLARQTIVEYHTLNGRKYAPSGFGAKAQWYKNIQANPLVTVQTASGTESMQAVRVTSDEELKAVYELFQHRNPAFFNYYLQSLGIQSTVADFITQKDKVHILRFDPTTETTPPGLTTDLTWVWPIVLLTLLGIWRTTINHKKG